jgi:hypothetical protein
MASLLLNPRRPSADYNYSLTSAAPGTASAFLLRVLKNLTESIAAGNQTRIVPLSILIEGGSQHNTTITGKGLSKPILQTFIFQDIQNPVNVTSECDAPAGILQQTQASSSKFMVH